MPYVPGPLGASSVVPFPGQNITVPLSAGKKIWFGSLYVQGHRSNVGASGVEWLIFASQPEPAFASGTSSVTPGIVPPLNIIDWAQIVTQPLFVNDSRAIIATLTSGGIPDTLSGGRAAVSGVIVAGALAGPAIGIQYWNIAPTSSVTAATQSLIANASTFVSGLNVGVMLVGN